MNKQSTTFKTLAPEDWEPQVKNEVIFKLRPKDTAMFIGEITFTGKRGLLHIRAAITINNQSRTFVVAHSCIVQLLDDHYFDQNGNWQFNLLNRNVITPQTAHLLAPATP